MTVYIEEGKKTGRLRLYFESVPEVFSTIAEQNWTPKHDKASNTSSYGDNFHVFNNLAQAHDVFFNAPESIRQFSINDEKLVSKDSPGKDIQYDVTGDYVDIDRYLEGVPENFGQMIMGNPKSVFATINVLNSAVHWTSPEYMLHKQKRIMRLVDWLEAQEIRCQIVMTTDDEIARIEVVVKQFHDPFDLNHLAVAMHPDFFRRTTFLLLEQSKTWTWGYGNTQEYDGKMMNYVPDPDDGLYVYVGGYIPYKSNDTSKLDRDFDKIEDNVQAMIDMDLAWTDVPLIVKGGSY